MVAVLIVVAASALGACNAIRRPATTVETLALDGRILRAVHDQFIAESLAKLTRRVAAKGQRTVDILLLSGGGQNGAYGAGFLRGWHENRVFPMPAFDVVTGVSAGAFVAPFAFVQTAASLDEASQLFLGGAEAMRPEINLFFLLRRTGGLYDVSRLRAGIRSRLTPGLLGEIAQAANNDRQLLIGTTDLDLGSPRVWDVTAAVFEPEGREDITDVILCSASIPGAFPPLVLEGHVHTDGGLAGNVLFPWSATDLASLATRLSTAPGPESALLVRVWMINHLWLPPEPQIVNPADIFEVSRRAALMQYYRHSMMQIEWLAGVTRAAMADASGLTIELRSITVPGQFAYDPAAGELMDGPFMEALEDAGYTRGLGPEPWPAVTGLFPASAR
jgi:hypothetical protein